jgi:hypothetical protein
MAAVYRPVTQKGMAQGVSGCAALHRTGKPPVADVTRSQVRGL